VLFCLQTYPPPHGTKLAFRDTAYEYAHAERLFKEGQSGGKPFGTLAKSEWEAVTLYIAFAFEKV
jgi:mRNA (guanine-N7-)-methyltransferase